MVIHNLGGHVCVCVCVCDIKKKEEQKAKVVTFRGSSFFRRNCSLLRGIPSSSVVKNLSAMQELQETWLDPWVWKIPYRISQHGNLLHYSCLKNPIDRGAWRATVLGVSKSQTRPR